MDERRDKCEEWEKMIINPTIKLIHFKQATICNARTFKKG